MKCTSYLLALFAAALAISTFAQDKKNDAPVYREGIFSFRETGHSDSIDHTRCTELSDGWHCSGDWEGPTPIVKRCVIRTPEADEIFLDCDSRAEFTRAISNLGLTAKVRFRIADKNQTAYILGDKDREERRLPILRILKEDPGVRKARIELCRQAVIEGDRCKGVPAPATEGAK